MPEFHLSSGEPIVLSAAINNDDPALLPGSHPEAAVSSAYQLQVREYHHPLFNIGHRVLQFFKRIRIGFKEKNEHIRLEAVISGTLPGVNEQGKPMKMLAGHYKISTRPELLELFHKGSACHYFVTHYSPELLEDMDIKDLVTPTNPKPLTPDMNDLIQSILHNPRTDKLRKLHYYNCIRELMELHLANPHLLPGHLDKKTIAAIYEADNIIRNNLKTHYTLPVLAKKVGMNKTSLSRGFKEIFECGVFERLSQHRLNKVKELLQTTNRTLDDIASIAGFAGRNTLIESFQLHFKTTPHKWKLSIQQEPE